MHQNDTGSLSLLEKEMDEEKLLSHVAFASGLQAVSLAVSFLIVMRVIHKRYSGAENKENLKLLSRAILLSYVGYFLIDTFFDTLLISDTVGMHAICFAKFLYAVFLLFYLRRMLHRYGLAERFRRSFLLFLYGWIAFDAAETIMAVMELILARLQV